MKGADAWMLGIGSSRPVQLCLARTTFRKASCAAAVTHAQHRLGPSNHVCQAVESQYRQEWHIDAKKRRSVVVGTHWDL